MFKALVEVCCAVGTAEWHVSPRGRRACMLSWHAGSSEQLVLQTIVTLHQQAMVRASCTAYHASLHCLSHHVIMLEAASDGEADCDSLRPGCWWQPVKRLLHAAPVRAPGKPLCHAAGQRSCLAPMAACMQGVSGRQCVVPHTTALLACIYGESARRPEAVCLRPHNCSALCADMAAPHWCSLPNAGDCSYCMAAVMSIMFI
jgi:hypothetical protein